MFDTTGVGQLLVVSSPRWATTSATIETFERDGRGAWQRVFDPMPAHIGRRGWTVGEQRGENDGSSPAGIYAIGGQNFGLAGNPGVRGSWFDVGPDDWWVSDPGSPLYNTHQLGPPDGRWDPSYGEQLAEVGPVAYSWAAFIEFNAPPQGALGSAVFLHLDTGGATAGCIALGEQDLLAVLRWLDPARTPRIAMGPESYLLAAPPAPVTTEAPATSPLPPPPPPPSPLTTTTMPSTTTTGSATTTTVTSTTTAAAPVVRRTGGPREGPWMPGVVGLGVAGAGSAVLWQRRRT